MKNVTKILTEVQEKETPTKSDRSVDKSSGVINLISDEESVEGDQVLRYLSEKHDQSPGTVITGLYHEVPTEEEEKYYPTNKSLGMYQKKWSYFCFNWFVT